MWSTDSGVSQGPGIREPLRTIQTDRGMTRRALLQKIASRIVEMTEQRQARQPGDTALSAAKDMRVKFLSHVHGTGAWRVELGC